MTHPAVRALIFAFVPLLLLGCSQPPAQIPPEPLADTAALKDLPISTPWGLPINGIRARIALDRDTAMETTSIRAALLLDNTTANPLAITAPAADPVAWLAGDLRLPVNTHFPAAAAEKTVSIQLPPHSTHLLGPWDVPIPPARDHLFLQAHFQSIQSPPIEIHVTPADWGPTVDGLRLRLSSPKPLYPVGQGAPLFLFIHNTTTRAIPVYDPNWETLDDDTKGDSTIISAKASEDQLTVIPPGGFIERKLPQPMLLAPGQYKLRFLLDSPELSIDHAPAWHGKLASNIFALEIR